MSFVAPWQERFGGGACCLERVQRSGFVVDVDDMMMNNAYTKDRYAFLKFTVR